MITKYLATDVIQAGADAFLIPAEQILANRRHKRIVMARHALFKAFSMRGSTHGQISRWMNKDRSSVTHGVRRAEQRMSEDRKYNEIVHRLADLGTPRHKGIK